MMQDKIPLGEAILIDRLPYNGLDVVISQGFNGPYSHYRISKNRDFTHSVDFALPLETEVIAVRSGIVYACSDDVITYYTGTNLDIGKKGVSNYIEILNEGKTIDHYQNLECGSVRDLGIKVGSKIKQDDVIGKTGLSGWIGPVLPLHFMVFPLNGYEVVTKRIKFADYDGPLDHILLSDFEKILDFYKFCKDRKLLSDFVEESPGLLKIID